MIRTSDFKHIRWSLLLATAMVVAGVAAVSFTTERLRQKQTYFEAARNQLNEANQRLARAEEEGQEITAKIRQYRKLQQSGILGEERRLDWVERIRKIKTVRRLQNVQYEIEPQQRWAPLPGDPVSRQFEFMVSRMRLSMPLLHEGDLTGFTEDLRTAVPAHVRVRSCSIERNQADIQQPGDAPTLLAECQIEWITIRNAQERP